MSQELQTISEEHKSTCNLKNLMAGLLVCMKGAVKISHNIAYDVREWWRQDGKKEMPYALGFVAICAAILGFMWFGVIVATQIFYWVGIVKMAILSSDINLSENIYFVNSFSKNAPLQDKAILEGIKVLVAVVYVAVIAVVVIVGGKILCTVGQDDKNSANDSQPE